MTHTQIVDLILDGTRSKGILFHSLTGVKRTRLKIAGREYMTIHASDNSENRVINLNKAATEILSIAKGWG